MQISLLSGAYTDKAGVFRTSYPVNRYPVPTQSGISAGHLKPADGIKTLSASAPGKDRGGIPWKGVCYRVRGESLCIVRANGSIEQLGTVGDDGKPVSMDYSTDYLVISSAGGMYLSAGGAPVKVTDTDLGQCLDACWIDGYFISHDGEFIVTTDLTNPLSVNPLKYGSSEADPDRVVALRKLRRELHVLNRHTIEVFQNVGGSGFPFAVQPGAQVPKGCIGKNAACEYRGAIAFLGSGRNEPPGIHLATGGQSVALSTEGIDAILQGYSEEELATTVLEPVQNKSISLLLVHLPDRCLVYDATASEAFQVPAWHERTSSIRGPGAYRARHFTWCYDKWIVGDPEGPYIGEMTDELSSHYGQTVGWEFGTQFMYNGGSSAIIHELELVGVTGRTAFGVDPVIWTSYTLDGSSWSREQSVRAGLRGESLKRLVWLQQGPINHWRAQRFRGTSDAHLSFARLDAAIEPLFSKRRAM